MVKQFIRDLWKGLCVSYNGIGLWIGAIYSIFGFILPAFDLGSKMNLITTAIPLPYRLLVLLGFILISVLLTSYSIYKKHHKDSEGQKREIDALNESLKKQKIDTKQQIRSFFESIKPGLSKPGILQSIDTGAEVITIGIEIADEVELKRLSKLPDFDTFLSFEEYEFGSYMLNCTPYKGYQLYPKDALKK